MADNFRVNDDLIKKLITLGLALADNGLLSPKGPVTAKTADYTVAVATDPSGACFTNRGAGGAVVFTLPAVTKQMAGTRYRFKGVANQSFTVAGTAGEVVAFNNAAATSLACSTAGQKIGAVIEAECDGTSWILSGVSVGVTYTVA